MNRASGAGVALAMLLTSACGISAEGSPRDLDPSSGAYRVLTRDPARPAVGARSVLLHLVEDGRLVGVRRGLPGSLTPQDVVDALAAGPTAQESAVGYSSAVPQGLAVLRRADGVLEVAVPAVEEARSDEVLGFAQLVLSLDALPGVSGVVFTRDGLPVDVPRADGSLTSAALTRADYVALLAP